MRIAPPVQLSEEDRSQLQALARARSLSARAVERAQIVLLAAMGKQDLEIAEELSVTPRTAARWRVRYLKAGIDGLKKDAPRPGRTPIFTPEKIRMVVEKTTQEKPPDATHWSTRSMAHARSEEHTSELQSRFDLVCRLLLDTTNNTHTNNYITLIIVYQSPDPISTYYY